MSENGGKHRSVLPQVQDDVLKCRVLCTTQRYSFYFHRQEGQSERERETTDTSHLKITKLKTDPGLKRHMVHKVWMGQLNSTERTTFGTEKILSGIRL